MGQLGDIRQDSSSIDLLVWVGVEEELEGSGRWLVTMLISEA
jgi:hypothetical protein